TPSLAPADFEASRLLLRAQGHRHGHLEHSVAEGDHRPRGINARRQRDGTVEGAVRALAVAVSFALLLPLRLALALDREQEIGDLYLNVLLSQARQVGADHELAFAFQDVDLRRPLGRNHPGLAA